MVVSLLPNLASRTHNHLFPCPTQTSRIISTYTSTSCACRQVYGVALRLHNRSFLCTRVPKICENKKEKCPFVSDVSVTMYRTYEQVVATGCHVGADLYKNESDDFLRSFSLPPRDSPVVESSHDSLDMHYLPRQYLKNPVVLPCQ